MKRSHQPLPPTLPEKAPTPTNLGPIQSPIQTPRSVPMKKSRSLERGPAWIHWNHPKARMARHISQSPPFGVKSVRTRSNPGAFWRCHPSHRAPQSRRTTAQGAVERHRWSVPRRNAGRSTRAGVPSTGSTKKDRSFGCVGA